MKNAKKLLILLLAFAVVFSAVLALSACSETAQCSAHRDTNNDGKCDDCGIKFEAAAPNCKVHVDVDKNAQCDVCGIRVECTSHVDVDKNAQCDVCGDTLVCSSHIDVDKNAQCDVCGEAIVCKSHSDANKNAVCDICGKVIPCSVHVDADKNAVCDVCGRAVACEEHTDANKDARCDVCGQGIACFEHEDVDKNAQCDVCGQSIACEEHRDDDKNAVCDVCGAFIICRVHTDIYPKDTVCDVCGKYVPCIAHVDTKPRDTACDVCGAYVACKTHLDVSPKNAICDICGEDVPCKTHTDNNEDDVCDVCSAILPCKTHVNINNDTTCDRCGADVPCNTHTDINKDNVCDVCGGVAPCAVHTDTDRDYICDVCKSRIPCRAHVDVDADTKCDRCGETVPCTAHIDMNSDSSCDKCGEAMPCKVHVDANGDTSCDRCGAFVPCKTHKDANGDNLCDVCGQTVINCTSHTDTNHDQLCDKCGAYVPCTSHVDNDKNAHCDYCNEFMPCETHVDTAPHDAVCDVCGEKLPCEHVDADPKDAVCDICGEKLPCEHVDYNRNGECDICGAAVEIGELKLQLIEGYMPNFKFVIASSAPAEVRRVIEMNIIPSLKKDFYIEWDDDLDGDGFCDTCGNPSVCNAHGIASVTEGYANDEESVIEVLVGDVTNRGDEYIIDRYSLGSKGYIIKAVNSKILINAGSDKKLVEALEEFADDFLGMSGDEIVDVTFTESDSIEEIQDDYRISSLAVNGTDMKGYSIIVEQYNAEYLAKAKELQTTIYEITGYWFKIVQVEPGTASDIANSVIIRQKAKEYGENSFTVNAVDNSLVIECAFDNKFNDAISTFITQKIVNASGKVNFVGDVYKQDISVVYYEDFGAKGNGSTDDFEAIYNAHVFANESGQIVKAKEGARYYIHTTYLESQKSVVEIPIRTNTVWTGAEFIIDDSDINYHKTAHGSKMATSNIFNVVSDYDTITITDKETLDAVGPIGRTYGTVKIDLGLGYPAMLVIYNSNHKVYRRSGATYIDEVNGTSQAGAQHELILIDAEGNIDPSTPFMFDYSTVTKIEVIRTDIEHITIKGGVVTTIACGEDCYYTEGDVLKKFGYYSRGLNVSRSYTTVDGVKHYITGEVTYEQQAMGIEGVHYQGFLYGRNATNVTFENCQVQGRRYYGISGTYDLGGNLVNNITFKGCNQINFWIDSEGRPSEFGAKGAELSMKWDLFDKTTYPDAYSTKVRHCWGVGGTNYCKNMNYIDSQLSRFDAHCGLYNGSVINCEITFFAITGNGTFTVRDTTWYSAGTGATDNSLIYMRGDYGSTWEGDVILDNVTAYASDGAFYMFYHSYNNWNYGYKCHIPNIEINDFSLCNVNTQAPVADGTNITFFTGGKNDYMHLEQTKGSDPKVVVKNPSTGLYELTTDPSGQYEFNHLTGLYEFNEDAPVMINRNHNPIGMPDYIKITNNPHKYKFEFVKSDDPNFYFANTKFYYSDTEYYQGTNHSGNDTFIFV